MRRTLLSLLASLLAVLVVATPAAAHHGKGSHARGPDSDDHRPRVSDDHRPRISKWKRQNGFAFCDWRSNPGSCPGGSGLANWCKQDHTIGWGRSLCLAEYARNWGFDLNRDDDDDNGRNGDLKITDIDVDDDGSFRVKGQGAEGDVTLWVGGVSGQVVGFGQGTSNGDGRFEIVGLWACRDDDAEHDARIRAQDGDERDSERVSFPCDEED
jgi:hypothetical protein